MMTDDTFHAQLDADTIAAAAEARAWPFEEARKIIKRHEKKGFPQTVLSLKRNEAGPHFQALAASQAPSSA